MSGTFAEELERSLSKELEDERTEVDELEGEFLAVTDDGETVLLLDVGEGESEPSRVFSEGYQLGLSDSSYLGICSKVSLKLYEYDEELGEWASEEKDDGIGSGLMALEAESKEDQLNTYMVVSEELEGGAGEAVEELQVFLETYVLD